MKKPKSTAKRKSNRLGGLFNQWILKSFIFKTSKNQSIITVFEELKQESGIDSNFGKEWFISLSSAYEKRGTNFIDEIRNEEKTSVQLAQEAMELPLSSALSMLSELFENEEEEET